MVFSLETVANKKKSKLKQIGLKTNQKGLKLCPRWFKI